MKYSIQMSCRAFALCHRSFTATLVAHLFLCSANAAPRVPYPPWPQTTLSIYSWDGVSLGNTRAPVAIGEQGATFADSWSGYSLIRDGVSMLPVTIPVVGDSGKTETASNTGAIRFWYSPNWTSTSKELGGTGPGHFSPLLEMANVGTKTYDVRWSLGIEEGGNTIYLAKFGEKDMTAFLQAPIQCQAGEWRLITVCYGPKTTALYVDGKLIGQGDGIPEPATWEAKNLGVTIGSDLTMQMTAEGQFDELTTFEKWPTPEDEAFYFRGVSRQVALGPLGTREEEAAKREQLSSTKSGMRTMDGPSLPGGGEGDGGTNNGGNGPMEASVYPTNALWLDITSVTNGNANIILHGTVPDMVYEILSRLILTNVPWASEGTVLGAPDQDWMPTTVPVLNRTNQLFIWARSWIDSDGSGLPDWWQLQFFGHLGVDPYGDPDNDGWNNLLEYQNGTNPNSFNTPAAPQGLEAHINAGGSNAVLRWLPSFGPVTAYTIERGSYFTNGTFQVSGITTQATDSAGAVPTWLYSEWDTAHYRIRAEYAGGSSAWSDWMLAPECRAPAARAMSGHSGEEILAVTEMGDAASVRVGTYIYDANYYPVSATNIDLPRTYFATGLGAAPEPLASTTTNRGYVRLISSNGIQSAIAYIWNPGHEAFLDCRQQLKQNLAFLLRSATETRPFSYASGLTTDGDVYYTSPYNMWHATEFLARPPSSTNYEHSSFHVYDYDYDLIREQQLRPVQDNAMWRNFTFNTGDVTNGTFQTGAGWDFYEQVRLLTNPKYRYSGTGAENPLPLTFGSADYTWAMSFWSFYSDTDTLADAGLYTVPDSPPFAPFLYLASNVRNVFGLPMNSVRFKSRSGWYTNALPGGVGIRVPDSAFYFAEVTEPTLQTLDYFFTSPVPYWSRTPDYPPQPGTPDFSPTNTSPPLIASVGDYYRVYGWAKQAILNGYTNRFAYLEQYFDMALKIGTNGVGTTNQTGILSPYGEFFPTEPGPTALVTMLADTNSNNRGTAVVNIVKLQLDVNHDGVMDLSFAGPDNTSQARPFMFWINNDHDEPTSGTKPDRDLNSWGNPPQNPPDYSYGHIRCQRNLEDLARLWVVGLPSVFPSGVTASLSFRNTHGNPRINLYFTYDSLGGTNYLSETNAAANQLFKFYVGNQLVTDYGVAVGVVGTNSTYDLPVGIVSRELLQNYFLFEGAGLGGGELVLTIWNGTNILAETSQWIELKDIKEMYEWAVVTNVIQRWPEMVEQLPTSGFNVVNSPAPAASEAKEVAVFVHGWRMPDWEAHNFAETMFKRLYWQGFQGRFAAVRWPTRSADSDPWRGLATYNRSEHIAFASGTGTAGYLNDLRSRFPDHRISVCAHSMGNIVMMQALKELANASQSPIDNYVLMQAAVAAHCYDGNVTNFPAFITAEQNVPTPDTYRNYAAGITNALRIGGRLVNFFNPLDFALASGAYNTQIGSWQFNEGVVFNDGTNGFFTMKPNTPLGYYHTNATGSLLRTNEYNTSLLSILWGGYYLSPPHPPIRTVTNTFEVMPFIARPRSKAVGAQAGVQGQIRGGEINLQNQLGFTAGTFDHSGQFNRNIQDVVVNGFYFELRRRIFPTE